MGDRECNSPEVRAPVQLAEDLRRVTGKFVRAIRSKSSTPTSSQTETIGLLDREGPMTVSDLASLRKVRHQSMRVTVAQLETAGLVAKAPNPADRRSVLFSLTEKGLMTLARSREARALQIADLIETRLSKDERDTLRAAIVILDRLSS